MAESSLKIETALLCDDIRREDNGKLILIGVYSGDVIVPVAPARLSLAVYVHILSLDVSRPVQLELKTEGAIRNLSEPSGPKTVVTKDLMQGADLIVGSGGIPVEINGPGRILFYARMEGDEWQEILAKKVEVTSLPNLSIFPKQPS